MQKPRTVELHAEISSMPDKFGLVDLSFQDGTLRGFIDGAEAVNATT